jgi:hypothetical protein
MIATAMRGLCRFLVVSVMMLSFQSAWAGMIGTQQAMSAGSAQADRLLVADALTRTDVKNQLEALGVDPGAVSDRVGAMTDEEVHALAGKLNSMPAGGDWGWWVGLVVVAVIVFMIWGSTSPRR